MKIQFDGVRDQEQVAQLLHAGCTHMRKAFDIEDINLEDLIATAMDDSQAVGENMRQPKMSWSSTSRPQRRLTLKFRLPSLLAPTRQSNEVPVGQSWMWTLAFGYHEDRTPTHGDAATREAAMTAFAKSWRRE